MDTRSNHNALAFDVTHRLVLAIAIPMTLGFMTTPLLGLTNTAVVGRMGNAEALAGLAIGAMLFDLILGSFNFLRASTTGLTAQAYGRRDQHEQQAVFSRAMISALGCGLALLCLSPLLMAAGLRLMGAEGAIAEATGTYFSIRMLAAPAALANYAILGFVLGRGQGNIGLLLQAIINGINILLSIYLGLTLDWGVAGVAWGTMAGETVGALAGLAIVLRGFGKAARPAWSEVFSRHRLAELFALNRDILIRTFVLIGAFTIMTRIGTSFGAVTLAANAVVMNFFLLSGYYLDGLANAAEQIIGRAIGAHYRPAFDRGLKLTTLWSFGLAALGSTRRPKPICPGRR
jgi:MATE family multidrug resistance protein